MDKAAARGMPHFGLFGLMFPFDVGPDDDDDDDDVDDVGEIIVLLVLSFGSLFVCWVIVVETVCGQDRCCCCCCCC